MDSLQSGFLLPAIFVSAGSPWPRFIVKVCFSVVKFNTALVLDWQYPPRKPIRAAPGYLHLACPGYRRNESALSLQLSSNGRQIKRLDFSSRLEWCRLMKLRWAAGISEMLLLFGLMQHKCLGVWRCSAWQNFPCPLNYINHIRSSQWSFPFPLKVQTVAIKHSPNPDKLNICTLDWLFGGHCFERNLCWRNPMVIPVSSDWGPPLGF
jgi:hypothetical protein